MLGTLGDAENAAMTLLRQNIAPEGSGKQAELIDAAKRERDGAYLMEFIVRGTDRRGISFEAHNMALIVFRPRDLSLFTLTILTPQSRWNDQVEADFRKILESFSTAP
mmetsp:Transcript_3528/g.6179  ORF Transcript_3528/g.6179 Transcript_3528/m.6179 type:complete len:108 (-) Transcript_3528:673-996(-)